MTSGIPAFSGELEPWGWSPPEDARAAIRIAGRGCRVGLRPGERHIAGV